MLDLQLSTIVFQILNFLILLVVLTRFLYRPVLRAMQQRQDTIAATLRAADDREKQAQADRERLAQQRQDARTEADRILAQVRTDAAAERERLIADAQQEASRLLDEAQHRIQEEERTALADMRGQIRGAAVTLAGTLIQQAAGPAVHQSLVDRLLATGPHTDGASQDALEHALLQSGEEFVVEVAYPADAVLQGRVRMLVPSHSKDLQFRVVPELLAGARIVASHQVIIDCSLRRTLADLQSRSNGQVSEGLGG